VPFHMHHCTPCAPHHYTACATAQVRQQQHVCADGTGAGFQHRGKGRTSGERYGRLCISRPSDPVSTLAALKQLPRSASFTVGALPASRVSLEAHSDGVTKQAS